MLSPFLLSRPQSGKKIFPFGDVKTNTSRFCKEQLAAGVAEGSGEWATVVTDVELEDHTVLKMFAVGHRRGPAIHTFLSTCGESTLGRPQSHKDDDLDADTGFLVLRKCPKILNDATTAQPKIDRHNKKRQFELALERRFRTHSFPFRLFSTILGMAVTDAYYLHNYINQTAKLEWADAMRQAAYAMAMNNLDAIASGDKDDDDLFQVPMAEAAQRHSSKRRRQTRGSDSDDSEGAEHYCIPLSQLEGYNYSKKKQQWCIVCKAKKVGYCCATCSTSTHVYALHPKKGNSSSTCLAEHRRQPSKFMPVIVRVREIEEAASSKVGGARPQRASAKRRERASARAKRKRSVDDEESGDDSGSESSDGGSYVPSDDDENDGGGERDALSDGAGSEWSDSMSG